MVQTWTSIPIAFDEPTGLAIVDRAKLILAPMIPGCKARRYDFPLSDDYSPVQLCFAAEGPIIPKLCFNAGPSYAIAGPSIVYDSMLRDALDIGTAFSGPRIPGAVRLDEGPEAMAAAFHAAIAKVDFGEMIAAGSIERILAERPRYPTPWHNIHLALCAVYLGRYQEAHGLLRDSIQCERKSKTILPHIIAEAENYLMKLESDADELRRELLATMDYNWSHFKIVGAETGAGAA